eukprot:4506041-Pyramimonas_sp.AAC.1
MRGTNVHNAGVTNVANTQEQAPCATYRFLGLVEVPYEAPVYNVGLPKDCQRWEGGYSLIVKLKTQRGGAGAAVRGAPPRRGAPQLRQYSRTLPARSACRRPPPLPLPGGYHRWMR